MLTFGYQSKFSGPFKALLAIAFGIFLILTQANAMKLVVQIISICIFVYGVFSFILGMKNSSLQMLTIGSVINIAISLLMFTFAEPISAVIRYILGSLLFLLGLYQTVVLFSARREIKGGVLPFILPVVVMVAGCIFFSKELIGNDLMGLLAGIAFVLFGLSELLASVKMNQAISKTETDKENSADGKLMQIDQKSVRDVDYEKVD